MYQQPNTEYMQNNKNLSTNNQKLNQVDDKPIINLPDILRENLDIIVVGITPSGMLGVSNHHFSGPGNHFWRCIAEVGLVSHPVTCEDDTKMLDYGIGFISFCTRPNKGTTELSRKEMKAGAALMVEKIKTFKPKIVVFNGIGIYEAFIGNKNFSMGLQPNKMEGTNSVIFVMPSSSARCAQLPRAEDKIPFFVSLKKLRDHMRGELPQLEEKEVVFENYTEFRVTQPDPRSLLKAERRRKRKAELSAESALQETVVDNTNFSGHEDNKQKTTMEIDSTKEDRNYENTQNPFPSSMQNPSTIVTPPLLSWPQSGGLTIIHTGQPIIMPSSGSQAAPSNTLLLLDPGSLSFSSIPVPMNQAHLQVRPMILPSDNESRVSSAVVSSSSPSTGTPTKHTEINAPPHFTNALQHIKARPVNDIIKSVAQIKHPTTRANSTNAKTTSLATMNSTVKTNCINQPKPVVEQTNKAIPSTITPTANAAITTTSTDNDSSIQISNTTTTAPPGNEKDRSTDEAALNQQNKSIPARPTNDPIDQWDLFMNGIYTGEFTYPAPPQTTVVSAAEAIAEYDQLSQSNVSRILTVLL